MKILSTVKLVGAAILAVAIFYVGGMASMQALHYFGNFEWAITTASFWLGGLVMVVVVVECVKRTIMAIAAMVEEEGPPPAPAAAADAENDVGERVAERVLDGREELFAQGRPQQGSNHHANREGIWDSDCHRCNAPLAEHGFGGPSWLRR